MKFCSTVFLLILVSFSFLTSQNQINVNLKSGDSDTYQIEDIREMIILEDVISVLNISLSADEVELKVNETYLIDYTITPENATNPSVTWTSDNSSIASVDDNGRITAVSTGEAIITVETIDGSFTDELSVSVTPLTSVETYDNGITIYPNPVENILNIESGEFLNFDIIVTDISGNIILTESNRNEIDFSEFAAGSYFLTLVVGDKQYNYSLIKK